MRINLANHIDDKTGDINWELLADTITVGVRFLDNVLDVNIYPLAEIEQNCQNVRRVGLGVMGLGHCLIKLGLRYDNAEGRRKVDQIFNFIKKKSYEASTYIAVEKGHFLPLRQINFWNQDFVLPYLRERERKLKNMGLGIVLY